MSRTERTQSVGAALVVVLVVALALFAVVGLSGCSGSGGKDTASRSQEMTPGEFPEKKAAEPVQPPPPMLKDPRSSVYSYLLWISYAYRISNSEVATMAFSPFEEVRVNSYVELNKQEARAIDQRLIGMNFKTVESKGDTATVTASEVWRYRYIKLGSDEYQGEPHTVSYDTTYTVVKYPDKGWLVDSVEASPQGGQQPE